MSTWRDRPTWRGVPVPWVARWTGEVREGLDRLDVAHHPDGTVATIRYGDEADGDRDAWGVLWLREGLAPGRGEPDFGQVHAARQRACMLTPRCQVCSTRFPAGEPVAFLLPPGESRGLAEHTDPATDTWFTVTPPTCVPCQDAAALYCPALRGRDLAVVTTSRLGAWGVYGDVVGPQHAAGDVVLIKRGNPAEVGDYVSLGDKVRLPATMARQMVVGAPAGTYTVTWRTIADPVLSDPPTTVTS